MANAMTPYAPDRRDRCMIQRLGWRSFVRSDSREPISRDAVAHLGCGEKGLRMRVHPVRDNDLTSSVPIGYSKGGESRDATETEIEPNAERKRHARGVSAFSTLLRARLLLGGRCDHECVA